MQKLGLSPQLPKPLEPLSDSELYQGTTTLIEGRSLSPNPKQENKAHLSDSEMFSERHSRKSSSSSLGGTNTTTSKWDWEWGDIPHKETESLTKIEPKSPSNTSKYFTPETTNSFPLEGADSKEANPFYFIHYISEREYFNSAFQHFLSNMNELLEGKCLFSGCSFVLLNPNSTQNDLDSVFLDHLVVQSNSSNPLDTFKELILDKKMVGKIGIFYLPINAILALVTGCLFGKKEFKDNEIENIRLEAEQCITSGQLESPIKLHTPTGIEIPSPIDKTSQGLGGRLKKWFRPSSPDPHATLDASSSSPMRLTAAATVTFKTPTSFVKTLRLTGNQLKQLELKNGLNYIRFSLAINETVNCSARVFLWKETTKVIISDIDGTITKSDALGHIFTFVGKDWTHSGVANLYTLIHKNGYQFMYLTSRAIGQATSTRDYLSGIDQNSFQLPVGPVIMSPDRLFVALHREVILKKPEEFKIIVLQDICRLFRRTKSPFFAGFGNRETDVVSYKAVNIPPSRIFLVTPVGDVSLNNLSIFFTTSYTKLTALVDKIFPPLSSEQDNDECEDFSDFLFWRSPIVDISANETFLASKESIGQSGEEILDESPDELPFI